MRMSSEDGGPKKRYASPRTLVRSDCGTAKGRPTDHSAIRDFGLFETCEEAVEVWDEDWAFCPVCGARPTHEGMFDHVDPGLKN